MSLVNIISSTTPLYKYERKFALCESCFWSATILYNPIKDKQTNGAIDKSILQICPECKNNSMSLIPLEKEEAYQISIGAKRGLEIQFSLLKHQKR
jgi:hypothetical protein